MKKLKKNYEPLEISVLLVNASDVITTSGGNENPGMDLDIDIWTPRY